AQGRRARRRCPPRRCRSPPGRAGTRGRRGAVSFGGERPGGDLIIIGRRRCHGHEGTADEEGRQAGGEGHGPGGHDGGGGGRHGRHGGAQSGPKGDREAQGEESAGEDRRRAEDGGQGGGGGGGGGRGPGDGPRGHRAQEAELAWPSPRMWVASCCWLPSWRGRYRPACV